MTTHTAVRALREAHGDQLPGLASGSRAADADEQPRSRGGGEARGSDRVRRHGDGRRATGQSFDAMVRTLEAARQRRNACWCSRAARSAYSARTNYAPRVLIANSNLVGHWSNYRRVPPAGATWADDVRADDGGLLDLHRQPGNHSGDVRDIRGGGAEALRRFAQEESWWCRADWAGWEGRSRSRRP